VILLALVVSSAITLGLFVFIAIKPLIDDRRNDRAQLDDTAVLLSPKPRYQPRHRADDRQETP
jgi:hypothetical protein